MASERAPQLAEGIRICVAALRTPVGTLRVVTSADSVLAIELPRHGAARSAERWKSSPLLAEARTAAMRQVLAELREYFAGTRRRFTVPLAPTGTEFQRRVWQAIIAVPFGETTSYGRIAMQLGGPHLARAVGAAVGANPIPIIIPCHRVIGSDDSLTGYGGGLRMKVWLLRHEGTLLA